MKSRSVPWRKNREESRMAAFNRQAPELVRKDQARLILQGWKPMEAAVEAWLTMRAGEK